MGEMLRCPGILTAAGNTVIALSTDDKSSSGYESNLDAQKAAHSGDPRRERSSGPDSPRCYVTLIIINAVPLSAQ